MSFYYRAKVSGNTEGEINPRMSEEVIVYKTAPINIFQIERKRIDLINT